MKSIECPHCKGHDIATSRIPKDVVAVITCAECRQLVVVFRDRAMPLSREVLEHGSTDERKAHLAEIVVEFLEPEMFARGLDQILRGDLEGHADEEGDGAPQAIPITRVDIQRFVSDELARIDDPEYFKKHFS